MGVKCKLSYILKSVPLLYTVYYYAGSLALRILGLFLATDDKLILFNAFGGKKYDDSPKAIYEYMQSDKRFSDYRLIWAFQAPEQIKIPKDMQFVKCDTFAYFVTALRAKVWITNSSMERGLRFKKRKTICLNTWHGTPIKKMGRDGIGTKSTFRSKGRFTGDIILAQGNYDVEKFSQAYGVSRSRYVLTGLPRNDALVHYSLKDIGRIHKELGLPADSNKKILLFAPTFREYTKEKDTGIVLHITLDPERWQKVLGEKYIVLFRAHYEVASYMHLSQYAVFKDVSAYPVLNDLMIVSDALISDYSSIFFDYSILGKPMYCFAYDYEEYAQKRGMYFDIRQELRGLSVQTEQELLELLQQADNGAWHETVRQFRQKYVQEYGKASQNACNVLYSALRPQAAD